LNTGEELGVEERNNLMSMKRKGLGMLWCVAASLAPGALKAQSIAISPSYTTVGVNGTVQYSAKVTGLNSTTVTWSVSGVKGGNAANGTITTGGLYTAPATIPANGITISALGSDGKTSAIVYVAVEPPGPSISSISPNPIPVGSYSITVTGTGFQNGAIVRTPGVNLSTTFVNSTTLKTGGYQPAAGTVAFQVENPGTLWGPAFNATFAASTPTPKQTISPTSATVKLGATKQFSSSGATSWSASAGSISTSGLFTAPSSMPSSSSVTVTATGPGGSASAAVTLQASSEQTISPTSAIVKLGATQQFTSSGATSWTATAGTVSTSGLFTAPSSMPSSSSVTVTATGPGGSASAVVTLQALASQSISPTSVSLNLGATQQFTSAGATSWTAAHGTITTAGFYTAPSTMPSTGTDAVTATGPNGIATAAVTLTAPVGPTPVITGVGSNGQLPLGIFTTTIAGTGFTSSSVAALNGTPLGATFSNGSLTATGFASLSGPGQVTVSNGSTASLPFTVQIGVPNAQVSSAAARRFLEQAAFGPTPTDAANLQTLGFEGWLTQQFNLAQVSNFNVITSSQGGMPAHFLTNAVTNPDQLRQRVAFALSQIFVTSLQKIIWNQNMVLFQNMLLADAFTNYRQIMGDVTLSPAMGQYLDMANNAMGNPSQGTLANENYARELMQLFTIGTEMLNQDGSLQYDSNHLPIPTYLQPTITEFARVYTGWTYAPAAGQPVQWNAYITSNGPMVPYPPEHDSGSKQLLNGYVSPAGATPQQDLNNALDNVFNHPNVGPFVGKMLIQHLVKSNPSPAYISRVASAFNNNGQGVRGDMPATITAVLLDPEARANDNGGSDQLSDGHLQEPALFIAGVVRAFGGQMTDQNYFPWDLDNLGQDLFDSPSVFNFYSPTYAVPGTNLLGPEFEIHTPNNAIWRADVVRTLFSQWSTAVQNYGPGTTVDLTAFVPLAATPATLVSALDLTLMHGTMPAGMKTAIVNAITADTSPALQKVEDACYLILTSSYYNVWH
jgi:Protein of unknown function (DUF1800)